MTANEKSILRARILKWLTRIFLIIIAVIMLFPLVWNIYSSFKTNTEFLANAFALPGGFGGCGYRRRESGTFMWRRLCPPPACAGCSPPPSI